MNGKDEAPYLPCTDTSDCVELSYASGLFLKPIARISITVTLPHLRAGQAISNKEVIEKLRSAIKPEIFTLIKVSKSNLEFLRLDAEIDHRKKLDFVIKKIDAKGIKLGGFSEVLKIRATEAKVPYPSRHDWDTFFRDTKHMNEMKPGERPDTVHIRGLPRQWFVHVEDVTQSKLSEYVVNAVFSSFGEVRIIDIPSLDPYRKRMPMSISGVSKFSFNEDVLFDVFIQYKEYIGFAKCMQALQNKKLVYKSHEHAFSASIQVDFDKSKHLSEYAIRQREIEREKLMAAEVQQGQKVRKIKEMEEMKRELEKISEDEKERQRNEEKENKRKVKEDKRKQKELKKRLKKILSKNKSVSVDNMEEILTETTSLEERKLVISQRKLECVRLFDKISERIRICAKEPGSADDFSSLGSWYNFECQALYKSKKGTLKKYKKYKTDENFMKYTAAARKLRKTVQKSKDKYATLCAQMNMKLGIIEDEAAKKKEATARRKLIKALKLRYTEQQQTQKKRVDKLLKGKVRIREDLDDGGKRAVIVSPATSADESDSSSSFTDLSSSDHEDKKNKSLKEDDINSEAFQKFLQHQRYGQFNQQNQYPISSYGSYRGRIRGYRPYYNRGFRGGPGFQDRGRGFFPRGRYIQRGRGNNYEYLKFFDHPIQRGQEKWFRRGGEDDEVDDYANDDKYSRSRSRSYDSRRSYSRSSSRRRSSSRSRSKDRRTRSRSWSKGSRRSDRKDRSRSTSKRRHSGSDRDRSRSRSADFKRRHRSRDSRSWSKSSRSSRHSHDRRKKSRHSRSKSRSRSHSRSRRHYESDVPSDIDMVEENPYYEFPKTHHYDKPYYDYRGRGNRRGGRGFRSYNQRRGRGWRARGHRGGSSSYYQQEQDFSLEYHNMYKRYFDSVTEKESKRHEDDYSDDEYRSRRSSGHRRSRRDESPQERKHKSRHSSEERSPDSGRLYSDKLAAKNIKDRLSSKSSKKHKKSKADSEVEFTEDSPKKSHRPREAVQVDLDVRYREEEERFRSEIVAKHSSRNIRSRLPASDEDIHVESRRHVRYQSDSDDEAYGPKPPPRRRR